MTDRVAHAYGTIAVVGGGCYGSYYVRQLQRARAAGRASWQRVVAVDRDASCRVARECAEGVAADSTAWHAIECVIGDWATWFAEWLGAAARNPAGHERDAIVPSPLMPHLLYDWLLGEARAGDPAAGGDAPPPIDGIPWQRAGADGTRYVSYATWMCPINCIEPAKCPHTRGERTWSLHRALPAARAEPTVVLGVTHRAYGVGMIDVASVLDARAAVVAAIAAGRSVRVATASHCHGAVATIRPGA